MPDAVTELLDRPADETASAPAEAAGLEADDVIADDELVEEISIDGMCGVY